MIDGHNIKDYHLGDLRRSMGLVMQEPTLFNYTISENILYGNSNALNSEIKEAAEVANALEFIESKELTNSFGDEPEVLLREMKKREDAIIKMIGDKEYREMTTQIEKIKKALEKKGKFVSVEGAIDERESDRRDINLSNGFNIDCGLKGCKLSGG